MMRMISLLMHESCLVVAVAPIEVPATIALLMLVVVVLVVALPPHVRVWGLTRSLGRTNLSKAWLHFDEIFKL